MMERAGIQQSTVSNRTIHRLLRRNGYFFLQARKKGLMTDRDSPNAWKTSIAVYLDGVSFYHKYNPVDQARAPRGRIWRKTSEGLKKGCTAKGSQVGSGGRVVKVIVAIRYNKGVTECYQYETRDSRLVQSLIYKFDTCYQNLQVSRQSSPESQSRVRFTSWPRGSPGDEKVFIDYQSYF